jgi:ketosteroid isomerase-like protein
MQPDGGLGRLPEGPVRRMFAAATQHDLDAMLLEFAEDYENITPVHPGRSFRGREQVRSNWSSLFAGIPDLALEVHDVAVNLEGKVWIEWSSTGNRRDGVHIEQAGVAIFTVRDDKLAVVRFYLEPVEHDSGDVNAAVRSVTAVQAPAPSAP